MAINIYHYAKIVHDKATLRSLLGKGNDIVRSCFEDHCDVEESIRQKKEYLKFLKDLRI